MPDYIKREHAVKAAYGAVTTEEFIDMLNAIPAADVEPVVYTERKEKTYHFDGEDHVGVVCSKCDASQFDGLGNARRCYNCGAHFGAHGKERER